MSEVLSQRESRRLIELERIIENGHKAFIEVGTALMEIQEGKFYRAEFKTFEDYCTSRWGMNVRTAYRRIESAKPVNKVVDSLCQSVTNPTTVIAQKASVNGVHVADPPDIAKARKTGRIPVDAFIEITEPDEPTTQEEIAEEHEEAAAQSQDEMGDEDWLQTLPLTKKLDSYCGKIFRKDALAWRALSKARASYLYAAQRVVKREDRGEFAFRVMHFLKMESPEKWNLCTAPKFGGCGGSGNVGPNNLECPKCRRRGYWIMGRAE